MHGRECHAWHPALPRQTAGLAVLPQLSRSCFQTCWFLHQRRHVAVPDSFPTRREGFCTPGTGGAFTASTDMVPIPSAGTAQEVGPMTSSPPSRGQSSGGALWRADYAPEYGQTSPAYSSHSVQCLYINPLLSVNKLVLSYLLLRLLPQTDHIFKNFLQIYKRISMFLRKSWWLKIS
jgi:hypothetical protein